MTEKRDRSRVHQGEPGSVHLIERDSAQQKKKRKEKKMWGSLQTARAFGARNDKKVK